MSGLLSDSANMIVASSMLSSTTNTHTVPGATIAVPETATHPTQVVVQPSEAQEMLQMFWQKQLNEAQHITANDFKIQDLPLARIKKIMKMDEDVKMISAEAPLLFAKAAQMFITELSLRAWIHTEENKRRTLQRNDIATAITKFDQFDFLIDIVPREELKPTRRSDNDNVQYFYTLPSQATQQNAQATVVTQNTTASGGNSAQSGQIVLAQSGGQILQLSSGGQFITSDGNQQVIQIPQQQNQQAGGGGAIIIGGNSQSQGIVLSSPQEHSTSQQNQAATQNVVQQLLGNSSSTSSEIHTIQISADGQLQLVKVTGSAENVSSQEQVCAADKVLLLKVADVDWADSVSY